MNPQLEKLLKRCTVKLSIPDKKAWGTGFFVAPGKILTCNHVVKDAKNDIVEVCWQNQQDFAEAVIEQSFPDFDLALLSFSPPIVDLACVYLDESFQADDSLYIYGYPDDFPQGAPVTVTCEGMTGDNPPLIKFKAGQIRPGLSGSPLLNQRTGKVCGIVKFTRASSSDLGGGAVPTREIFTQFPQLMELQQGFHQQDNRWTKLLPRTPSQTKLSRQENRNRQALLNLVKKSWVKKVLEKSLHNQVLIELGLEERPDALAQPWNMVLQTPNENPIPLPQGTKVIDLFDEIGEGRTLLILGEPGSGKTTTLLELARDLIARAEQDVDHLIPVVFNLSSWAIKKHKIENWLVKELNDKYQVPQEFGQILVKEDKLLLLLDGLDEVQAEYREQCIAALNQFNREHCPEIVVCSRIKDYEALSNCLNFQKSVYLRLLTLEQVRHYLNKLGSDLTGLRTLVEQDRVLQDLVQSPLILNIMTLTYQGVAIEDLPKTNVIEERRRQLFDDYIDKMFKRRGASQRYSKSQVKYWLSWLAQKMIQESQTIFLIEKMQPTWLQTNLQKLVYVLGITINILLVSSFFPFLNFLIFGVDNGDIGSFVWSKIIYLTYSSIMLWNLILKKTSSSSNNFVIRFFLKINFVNPLVYELIVRNFVLPDIKPVESVKLSFNKNNIIKNFKTSLVPVYRPILIVISKGYFLIQLLVNKLLSVLANISNPNLKLVILGILFLILVIFFLSGIPFIILEILLFPLLFFVLFVLIFSITWIVFSPFLLFLSIITVQTELEKTIVPNQGIWKSLKNTRVFIFVGAIIGVIGAISMQFITHQNSPNQLLDWLIVASFALLLGSISLQACNKHFILRVILYFKGYIPWNYARFLDYASERIFLSKVGGGYIFIHRMLMEHFAQMELENKSIQITAKTLNNRRTIF